jgi:TrmH family RNA methyltransferase
MLATTAVPKDLSRLTSRQHPIVQAFREAAADPAHAAAVLLDGPHLLAEALAAGVRVTTLLVDSDVLAGAARVDRELIDRAAAAGAIVHHATASVIAAASPVRTSSGIVALAEWTPAPVAAACQSSRAFVLALVDVQDPGNVGAAIRSADALGGTGVVAVNATPHPGNWKALRGAMGSTFRLPVARAPHTLLMAEARRAGLHVLATVAQAATPPDRIDLTRPTLVLLGNEGGGLPDSIVADADARVTIPMRQGVSSLNVAVTAALLLYEARRQRT